MILLRRSFPVKNQKVYDPLHQGFEDPKYFYTGADGAMVFHTPLGQGVSTKTLPISGQNYESYTIGNREKTSEANWQAKGFHELKATLSVTEFFEGDPQTVVGQIHAKDSSKALVKLLWDGPSKPVREILNKGQFQVVV